MCREDKESVDGGCGWRVCKEDKESVDGECIGIVRRVWSCPQGLELRERERPEILVNNINTHLEFLTT